MAFRIGLVPDLASDWNLNWIHTKLGPFWGNNQEIQVILVSLFHGMLIELG